MSARFHDAAQFLSSSPALAKVSNDVKLELYGLFKYTTVAHVPDTPRPGLLDFAGRAKWDAWAGAGKHFSDAEADAAEARYLEIARGLGWQEGVATDPSTANTSPSTLVKRDDVNMEGEGDEDIWDPPNYQHPSASGEGLGNIVSSMVESEPVEITNERPIHALTLAGNADALARFLDENPGTNLNEADEFGYTALHLACDRGHVAEVKLLLDRGADRTIQDSDEMTALEIAQVAGWTNIEVLLKAE